MKKLLLSLGAVLMASALFVSCDDDEGNGKMTGNYTFDSEEININNAYYSYSEDDGDYYYDFLLTEGSLSGNYINDYPDDVNYIYFFIKEDYLGEVITFDGNTPHKAYFKIGYVDDSCSGYNNDLECISSGGTIKVVKNGTDNFTLKIHLEVDSDDVDCEVSGKMVSKQYDTSVW